MLVGIAMIKDGIDLTARPPSNTASRRSESLRTVILKIVGTDEVLNVPCKNCTTAGDIIEFLEEKTMTEQGKITLFEKRGAYMSKQQHSTSAAPVTFVKGIKSFGVERSNWAHPAGIIGAGYHSMKTAMTYVMDGDENFILWDRNKIFGGYCWITGANKTSRLQTEMGSFHIWWGPQCLRTGRVDYPNCNVFHDQGGWHVWPYKEEIQKHFAHAAEQFGLAAHTQFGTNVDRMKIIGDRQDESRHYQMTVRKLEDASTSEVNVSVLWTHCGSLTQNRIIEYPGEDEFGGEIRYGMNDDTPYEKLAGATIAILGNGAFAVENARTTLECSGKKAYIITRRKNLASPRLPSWFVHQGPLPIPGWLLLKTFEPMYELANFGDPWSFWSVHANTARNNVTIIQNSRFGIGDVTFLMHSWGVLEYIVTTLKRCSRHTLHLDNGVKLQGVTIILKALGLLGDYSVDKLHMMKQMVGPFCDGDWRRPLHIDATGMNAANFEALSTGIFTTSYVTTMKLFFDYPKQMYKAQALGLFSELPKHKEEAEIEKPAYVTDVKFDQTSSMILIKFCPQLQRIMGKQAEEHGNYKYAMYHKSHSFERTLKVAQDEWDAYQEEWKRRGVEHDYVPYPYTREIVSGWFDAFNEALSSKPAGLKTMTSIDGPRPGEKTVDFQLGF